MSNLSIKLTVTGLKVLGRQGFCTEGHRELDLEPVELPIIRDLLLFMSNLPKKLKVTGLKCSFDIGQTRFLH